MSEDMEQEWEKLLAMVYKRLCFDPKHLMNSAYKLCAIVSEINS
jgi:hypothetical protein